MLSDVDQPSGKYIDSGLFRVLLFLCIFTERAHLGIEMQWDGVLMLKMIVRKNIWMAFQVMPGWFENFRTCYFFSESIDRKGRRQVQVIGFTSSRWRKGNNSSTLLRSQAYKQDHLWMLSNLQLCTSSSGRTVSVTSKITKYSRWSGRRVSLLFQADIHRVDDNGHGKQPARISKILPERSSQALWPTGPSATGLQLQHLEFRKKGVINHWRSPMVVIVTINRTMGEKVLIMFGCITLCNLCIEKAAKHSLQQGKRNKWGHTKSTHTHTHTYTGLPGLRGTGWERRAVWWQLNHCSKSFGTGNYRNVLLCYF